MDKSIQEVFKFRVYGDGFYLATYTAEDEDCAIEMAKEDWPEYCGDRMKAVYMGEDNRKYPL